MLSLSIFHFDICSFEKRFYNFHILLYKLNINLDIIGSTESHIKENVPCHMNTQLPNYSIEHTPTQVSVGGTLLYINSRLSCKPRADVKLYAPAKLESLFLEIICINTSTLIIGCNASYWYL